MRLLHFRYEMEIFLHRFELWDRDRGAVEQERIERLDLWSFLGGENGGHQFLLTFQ
jgi:hypothetical protein